MPPSAPRTGASSTSICSRRRTRSTGRAPTASSRGSRVGTPLRARRRGRRARTRRPPPRGARALRRPRAPPGSSSRRDAGRGSATSVPRTGGDPPDDRGPHGTSCPSSPPAVLTTFTRVAARELGSAPSGARRSRVWTYRSPRPRRARCPLPKRRGEWRCCSAAPSRAVAARRSGPPAAEQPSIDFVDVRLPPRPSAGFVLDSSARRLVRGLPARARYRRRLHGRCLALHEARGPSRRPGGGRELRGVLVSDEAVVGARVAYVIAHVSGIEEVPSR